MSYRHKVCKAAEIKILWKWFRDSQYLPFYIMFYRKSFSQTLDIYKVTQYIEGDKLEIERSSDPFYQCIRFHLVQADVKVLTTDVISVISLFK